MKSSTRILIPGYPQADCVPPFPKTNYSNPRCYARELNDCGGPISREHYISENALKLWSVDNFVLTNFFDLENDRLAPLKTNNFGANILCKRHNEALSSLDEIGGNFCSFVKDGKTDKQIDVINGSDVERWFLKIFLGQSIIYYERKLGKKNWQPPRQLLENLFFGKPFDKGIGLYTFVFNNLANFVNALGYSYISDKETNEGVGINFNIEGIEFFFGIKEPPSIPNNPNLAICYHPSQLVIIENSSKRELFTGWVNGEIITFNKDKWFILPS
ncbi:MAG: hypothetical protein VB013_05745 [Anaerolineaceae bacterium]|nr:hypothetical protein [Anaerolineaceae bacterium]